MYGFEVFSGWGNIHSKWFISLAVYFKIFSRKMYLTLQFRVSPAISMWVYTFFSFASLCSTSSHLCLSCLSLQLWRSFLCRIGKMAQLGDLLKCSKHIREASALTPQKVASAVKAASVCLRHSSGNFLSRLYCLYQ